MNECKIKAIVIEDNTTMRHLIKEIFTLKGVEVFDYENPQKCLQVLLGNHNQSKCPCVDFLFTDNMMPNMTGIEFIKQLKTIGCKLPPERMAIASGYWNAQDREQASDLGCKLFDKPFAIDIIYEWVDKIFDRKKAVIINK